MTTKSSMDKMASVDLKKYGQQLEKILRPLLDFLSVVIPHVITFSQNAYQHYQALDQDTIQFVIGFIFCFFGGMYPLCFAAIEAAKQGGFDTLLKAFKDLSNEALIIIDANKKDDELDEDKDGVKDVKQIPANELVMRKVNLVLVKMNPKKVDDALSSIYKVWLSVLAVLTMQFARTISLGVTISDFLKRPLLRYVSPFIQAFVPDQYDKWIPILLGWFAKAVAVSIAWSIQAVMSAISSAMRGSLMMSRTMLSILNKKKWTLGGLLPADHQDTLIDEYLSYALVIFGVFFQVRNSFDVGFPWNIMVFPLDIIEYLLRWHITKVH